MLGCKFNKNGSVLYAAVTGVGLVKISDLRGDKVKDIKVEVLASGFYDNSGGEKSKCDGNVQEENAEECTAKWSEIRFADDVDVGPKTGHVYFTDASDIAPAYDWETQTHDVMDTYKTDFLRGNPKGRLLCYNPKTTKIDVLADGIWFANGIAVDPNEEFVLVASTSSSRVLKYHLEGKKKGEVEVLLDGYFFDGIDCSTNGKCYGVIPTAPPLLVKVLSALDPVVNRWLRFACMMMPKSFMPSVVPYVGIVEFDPKDGKVSKFIVDAKGKTLKTFNGVTEHNGKLYLGSLSNEFIGVVTL